MHWDWKETLLQSSKSRFRRSGSDLSVKTCSDCQLKIAFSNILSAKVNELSTMYIAIAYLKDSFYIEIGELSKSAIMFSALKLPKSAK